MLQVIDVSLSQETQQGIALHILQRDDYPTWLDKQNTHTKNWLLSTQYATKGLTLIPDHHGALASAIFVCGSLSDFFCCGELASKLPVGSYVLDARAEHLEAIAFSWLMGCYRFERYKKNKQQLPTLLVAEAALVNKVNRDAAATNLVRDLINTPAADMMPQDLAQCAQQLAQQFGASVTQIIGDDLLAQNYPTIHAVGRASLHQPQLIDLHWGDEKHPLVTLVGKGVCFDSGGLDLKSNAGMRFMKKDMGGSAHVLGLAYLIMADQLPVRLRVLMPAVENAVSANAMRPGDVITTRNGTTVEIDNTDAEGRLVLCDAICEAINDSPDLLIDFATLTGAMRVALGTELPGFFASNKQTALALMAIGETNSDPLWQMPLHQPYKSLLKSEIADLTNCSSGPYGSAITAALYLEDFTQGHPDWLHFDIMAWNNRSLPGRPVGGEAFGIRTVFQYLQQRYTSH